jgi:hypothetical protein
MITENKNQIAKTILNQLGGNKFVVMTGAKNLGAGENYLSFKVMRNASKATHIKITLNAMDTYDIEFIRCRKFEAKTLKTVEGIYAEDLQSIFTRETGLNTSL